jgi:endonuclease G, mitochondrial
VQTLPDCIYTLRCADCVTAELSQSKPRIGQADARRRWGPTPALWIFAALVCFFTSSAFAGFESCPQFFPSGSPPEVSSAAPGQQREVCFDSFAVLYSGHSKTPVYVVERLNRQALEEAKDGLRTNRFYEEARLPFAERSTLKDYKARLSDGRRFDRGHMAPAGDMSTEEGMAQSFSLANMIPQAPRNNRRAWASIEKATRKYVLRAQGDVFVFTGPVFEAPVDKLGAGQVWIPRYLFKLVYDPATGRSWAHWLENTDEARVGPPISYEELVHRTGTVFLNPKGRATQDKPWTFPRLRRLLSRH